MSADAARALGGGRFFWAAGLYTAVTNGLALTGPAYMLLLYDRALPARDVEGLIVLTLLMLLLYALSGGLDRLRQVHMLRGARRIDRLLCVRAARRLDDFPARDIDQIRAFLTGYGPCALCDLPWVPLYLVLMFLLHPLLGMLALAGVLLLAGLLLAAEQRSIAPALRAAHAAEHRQRLVTSRALPLALLRANARLRAEQEAAAQPGIAAATVLRAMRPALQSATLGLGVYLAMSGTSHPASVLAACIVLPRVLGPPEMALAHLRSLRAAYASALRLRAPLTSAQRRASSGRARDVGASVRIILRKAGGNASGGSGGSEWASPG